MGIAKAETGASEKGCCAAGAGVSEGHNVTGPGNTGKTAGCNQCCYVYELPLQKNMVRVMLMGTEQRGGNTSLPHSSLEVIYTFPLGSLNL